MPRTWCVVVRPAETASSAQVAHLGELFSGEGSGLDCGQVGGEWHVYVDELDDRTSGEPAVVNLLTASDLSQAVVMPLPIGRWFENQKRYVVSEGQTRRAR
jgi:hypothetical protein